MRKILLKKPTYRNYHFYEPVYLAGVDFYIGKEVDLSTEYNIKSPLMAQSGKAGKTLSLAKDGEADKFVVWIVDAKDIDTLAHECVHLVNAIFKSSGVTIDVDNDETQAYYVSYWFAKLRAVL